MTEQRHLFDLANPPLIQIEPDPPPCPELDRLIEGIEEVLEKAKKQERKESTR